MASTLMAKAEAEIFIELGQKRCRVQQDKYIIIHCNGSHNLFRNIVFGKEYKYK
jgi:hypothetical protein